MEFINFMKQPWPWYIAGPLIGLMVPALLIMGNKTLGISSSLRHVCAACIPANISFFHYNWKKEAWNLFFVAGILAGGFIAQNFLYNHQPIQLNSQLVKNACRLWHYRPSHFGAATAFLILKRYLP